MKRLLLAILCLALLPGTAHAAKPPGGSGTQPLTWAISGSVQFDNPIEQQTDWPFPADLAEWVINPTDDCVWDVDDNYTYFGYGSVVAGSNASISQCFVSDPTSIYKTNYGHTAYWSQAHKYLAFSLSAPKPGLVVTVCYTPQGRCFTPKPYLLNNRYTYESCTQVAYRDENDPDVYEIPGSQGGIGVITDVTVTVSNPTRQTIKDLQSATGPSWTEAGAALQGCRGKYDLLTITEYPYRYWIS